MIERWRFVVEQCREISPPNLFAFGVRRGGGRSDR
jgi:hypothetical protein